MDWSGLLPELLEQIATRLPLPEDFTAFRGVCTSWRYAVPKNKYKCKVPLLMLAEEHPSYKYHMRKKYHSYTCKVDGLVIKEEPGYKYDLRNGYRSRKCKVRRLYRREKKVESHEREFYSLSKRKICARLPFPEAKDKKCLDVGFGWMLTVSALGGTKYGSCLPLDDSGTEFHLDGNGTDFGKYSLGEISDGRVSLVKPFYSCPEIQLPNLNTFSKYEKSGRFPDFHYVAQAVLLADPSVTSDFMLVLLSADYLIIWKNGDRKWRRITSAKPCRRFLNMVHYKGCIYAMASGGRIWSWDPNVTKARQIMELDGDARVCVDHRMPYLVESTEGELLLIVRNNHEKSKRHNKGKLADFYVMRIDLETHTTEPKNNVGKDAIFIGSNTTTVAVPAADYLGVLKPNCIYFTDDFVDGYFDEPEYGKGGGMDMGIYNVEDESVERFGIESYSHISPPMWVFPSF